ncbi:MAG: DUF5320 domain-containing protein [Clostridia bacterium]|nr:DUF5320 domain-containing protein [Clostridia bacterium]MDD4686384.1 DUF5320 domain-containing protein [Clostridia bacterium]
MPRIDGTGPLGQGTRTGRGLGDCDGSNRPAGEQSLDYGMNRRRSNSLNSKEALINQKAILEAKLDAVNKQLNS